MQKSKCPICGSEVASDSARPHPGPVAFLGADVALTPTPPPETASWDIEHASPDVLAWAKQTFNEAEFLAALHETQVSGGVPIDDLIVEIERKLNGSA